MTRPVQWLATDIPRSAFDADLLPSLEAGLVAIVSQIRRSNVEERVKAALGRVGVDLSAEPTAPARIAETLQKDAVDLGGTDLELLAREQIRDAIWNAFPGTDLAALLAGLLQAQGYRTTIFPEEKANAVDVVAQRGPASPRRLLVRVATGTPTPGQEAGRKLGATAIQDFRNAMQFRDAQHGILVAWSGFRENAFAEAQRLPNVQLRDADHILDAFLDQYEALPDDLQAAIPLKRIWALLPPAR